MAANEKNVNKVLDGMLFGKSRLINVQQNLIKAMQKGLSARNAKEHAEASVKMLPTYRTVFSRIPFGFPDFGLRSAQRRTHGLLHWSIINC